MLSTDEDTIRKFIIKNRKTIKRLMTSEHDLILLNFISNKKFTSAEYAVLKDCSIQLASNKLKTLYEKGYLDRIERVHETGGIEYEYFLVEGLYDSKDENSINPV